MLPFSVHFKTLLFRRLIDVQIPPFSKLYGFCPSVILYVCSWSHSDTKLTPSIMYPPAVVFISSPLISSATFFIFNLLFCFCTRSYSTQICFFDIFVFFSLSRRRSRLSKCFHIKPTEISIYAYSAIS